MAVNREGKSVRLNNLWEHIEVGDNAPFDGIIISYEYASWLATLLDDRCECGPFQNHKKCIAEIDSIVEKWSIPT